MRAPRAIACPHCGGTVAPPLASRKVACRFCGESHYYLGEDFLPCLAFAPGVEEPLARGRILALFRSALLPTDFSRKALLVRSWRSYIPFYLLTGKRGGILTAGRERVQLGVRPINLEAEGGGPYAGRPLRYQHPKVKTIREEDARVVLGDFRYLYSAASLSSWGLRDEALREELLRNLDAARPSSKAVLAKDGEVVDPDIPLQQLVEKGVSAQEASGDMKILDLQPTLIFVPVRTFVFRYGEEYFLVRAEEISGAPLGGVLPFRRDWYALLGLPMVAALGLVTGLSLKIFGLAPASELFRAMITLGPFPCILFLGGAAILGMGLSTAWEIMRRPSRVRLTSTGLRWETAAAPVNDPFGGFSEFCWNLLKTIAEARNPRS